MDPLQVFWHLAGPWMMPVLLGTLVATGAMLCWRSARGWRRWAVNAAWCAGVASAAMAAGWVVTGRDGAMLTYAAMVAASAAVLGWRLRRAG